MIIDSHIHLYDERYKKKFQQIIEDAFAANVRGMIVVGSDFETSIKAIKLAEEYDFLYAAVGLHPSEVNKEKDKSLSWLHDLSQHPRVVAIGEIGLDYYWDKTFAVLQQKLFIKQIEIAQKRELPLSIHSRSAALDTYKILMKHQIPGVLHCYSMSLEFARDFVEAGYYLGIGGVLTFKNSKEIKRVVEEIDIKHLLVETDGPYLTPEPFRGKLNKPSYLKYIMQEISLIKGLDYDEVVKQIRENTNRLFGI